VQLPGSSRQRLAHALNAAYADGLLSEQTLSYRLDVLFRSRLVDPVGLVGDLTRRTARRAWRAKIANALQAAARRLKRTAGVAVPEEPMLLALDWSGVQQELVLGRDPICDVVLAEGSVSRRHAQLRFHDGGWTLRDLDSTNGTRVNGLRVGRCKLRPGDRLALGKERLLVD
jgi:pSer/pThr/pTyr-binding forkhead associated (FHA) protein